jgi:hypothetical protein
MPLGAYEIVRCVERAVLGREGGVEVVHADGRYCNDSDLGQRLLNKIMKGE